MPVMKQLNMGGTTYDTVGEASVTRVVTTGTKIATITIDGTSSDLYAPSGSSVDPATASPQMDGTAAVGSSAKYAREDHVHPTDTSRQETLVSGTNIKTVNGESLLGSGNITIQGGGGATVSSLQVTLTANGWTAGQEFYYVQTVSAQGVTGSSNIIVTPSSAVGAKNWSLHSVWCYNAATNSLTFQATTRPDTSIYVNVLVIN